MKKPGEGSFRHDHERLRAAQKSPKGAPLYSLAINRPLGRIFATVAHQMGLTPNQVTVMSALFTFVGIALVAVLPPGLPMALTVTMALAVGYALDAADGQLARLRGGGSLTGEWLDHVIDSVKIATLHLAVLVSMYRFSDVPSGWLLVPIVFSATYVVHFFGMLLTDLLTRNAQLSAGSVPKAPRVGSSLIALIKLPTDYGLLCLSFILLAAPTVFRWTYAILAVAMLGYTLLALVAWYRRLQALDAQGGVAR